MHIFLRQPFAYVRSKILKFALSSRGRDEFVFLRRYRKELGYLPNFAKPQTLNEKIVHRILYDRSPIYTALADQARTCIVSSSALALRARICMSLQGAGEAGQEGLQEGGR